VPRVSWQSVDGGGALGINHDTTRDAHYPQLTVFGSDLYVTWYEDTVPSSQIRVARMVDAGQGATWQPIDGGGATGLNRDPTQAAFWSRLVTFNTRLYCYWYEKLINGTTTIRVAVYNGDPQNPIWSYVDGSPASGLRYDPSGTADYATLESFNGKLYAAWRETDAQSPFQIRVAVYNGNDAAPAWNFVDRGAAGGINFNTGIEAYYPKLSAYNGKLYAMWYELNGISRTIHCAVYNSDDSIPLWNMIGGADANGLNFDPSKDAHGPQMLTVSGSLYGLWYERGADLISHVRVARYNGNDGNPSWSFVDGGTGAGLNRDPNADAWWPRATGLGIQLFAAWTEPVQGVYRIHVSALDTGSGTWTPVEGGQGLDSPGAGSAEYPHMTTLGQKIFVAWSERRNGVLQVRVMRGDPATP
jgi:hypothetical protein